MNVVLYSVWLECKFDLFLKTDGFDGLNDIECKISA